MARINDERKYSFPDEPWRWRDDWDSATISTNNKSAMIMSLALALTWNALVWPATLLVLPDELRNGNFAALWMLLFPAVGLLLLTMGVRSVQRYMKYGESIFRLASNPGVVGGAVAGIVEAGRQLQPANGFRIQLNCISRHIQGTGKHRRVNETVLWQSMRTVLRSLASDSPHSAIPIQFAIPFDAKASSRNSVAAERIYWTLQVTAEEPGIDYCANFEIPMFHTAESDPNFQLDEQLVQDYVHVPSIEDVYQEARLIRHETPQGIRLESPLFRNAKMALGTTLFTLIWLGITVFFVYATNDGGFLRVFSLFFIGAFGLFGLLTTCFAIELWLWRSTNTITKRGIESRTGILGFARTRTFDTSEIKKLSFKKTMQSGLTIFHDLNLETTSGRKHGLFRRIVNEAAARQIIEDIELHLGRSTNAPPRGDSQKPSSIANIIPALDGHSPDLAATIVQR